MSDAQEGAPMDIIRADSRGASRFEWLDSRHTFSFGSYYDAARMGVSALRVINDDLVAPGAGFETHGHRDMEILSYVTEGAMRHRDSTGQEGLITAGQFQLMTAGRGILHSEFNDSATEPLAFLQIWIRPAAPGGTPGYQQRDFPRVPGRQRIASPDGPLRLGQDASVSRVLLPPGASEKLELAPGRVGYLHLVAGKLHLDGVTLARGDGAALRDAPRLELRADDAAEALWFELPPA
jgi:hypothetical protein